MINLIGIASLKKNNSNSNNNLSKIVSSMQYFGHNPKIKFSIKGIDLVADHEKTNNNRKNRLDNAFTNNKQTIFLIGEASLVNYKKLREKLEEKNYSFLTNFHEELMLYLYEEYGTDFLKMLNGNFICTLWDKKKKMLLVATDRFNSQPIYYTTTKDKIIFSSTIKSLLSYGLPRILDRESILLLLQNKWNSLNAPKTLIKDIFQLTNATALIIKNGRINYKKYWDFNFNPKKVPYSYVIKKFRQLLEDSVKENLKLGEKACVSLSGGIDSSLIVAVMSRFDNQIRTFNFVYKDGWDERFGARAIAKKFSTCHSEIDVSFEDIYNNLFRATWHSDKFNTAMLAETRILLCEKAKKYTDQIFVGHGADEIFGTAEARMIHFAYELKKRTPKIMNPLIPIASRATKVISPKLSELISTDLSPNKLYSIYESALSHKEIKKIISKSFLKNKIPTSQEYNLLKKNESLSFFYRAYYNHINGIFLNRILPPTIIGASINNMKIAFPYLDNKIVEFSESVPLKYFLAGINKNKKILQDVAKPFLPKEIYAKKNVPLYPRIGVTKEQIEILKPLFKNLEKRNIFAKGFPEKILERTDRQGMFTKATLLRLELWIEIFIDQIPSKKPPKNKIL